MDPRATEIADSLPTTEESEDPNAGEVIPLSDIVINAIEHNEWQHFRVRKYDPDADGVEREWAVVQGLPAAFTDAEMAAFASDTNHATPPFVILDAATVRLGVEAYLNDRLDRGMSEDDARKMVDGVYTDAIVCDSIVQFIVYGEEVLG